MPPKRQRKGAARGAKETTDSEEEPKSKRQCAAPGPVLKKKKSRAYKMPPPLPAGLVLTDVSGKHSWSLEVSVGKGGFGEIYKASPVDSSKKTQQQHVIKIEPHENGPLFTEIAFYCRVCKEEMIDSWVSSHKLAYLPIPRHVTHGRHNHARVDYRFLVMDCFGEDVEKKFNQSDRCFGIKTVCHLAIRILEALEYLHTAEYAHGDIKGSNLLTGLDPSQQHQVYLVDYGLAYRYRPEGRHKEYKEDPRRQHDGTLEFTSIDAHKGVSPSARGDLEILAYCLLQWWSGFLPWHQHVAKDDKESVAQMKIRYKSDIGGLLKACFKSSTPPTSLKHYLTYVYGLDYTAKPDYGKVRQMFVKELSSLGLRDDGRDLDWTATSSTAVAVDECDSESIPPARKKAAAKRSARKTKTESEPKKKASGGKGKEKMISSPEVAVSPSSDNGGNGSEPEPPEAIPERGKRSTTTATTSRRKKLPESKGLPPTVPIKPAPSAAVSDIIPQASYPASLGYVENGDPDDLVVTRSKRSRTGLNKKTSSSLPSCSSSSSTSRPKRKSPVKPKGAVKSSRDSKKTKDRT